MYMYSLKTTFFGYLFNFYFLSIPDFYSRMPNIKNDNILISLATFYYENLRINSKIF